jgi:CheY-like chemotaxis protein
MAGGDGIPVIVVTASDDRNLRYEVLESGATDVLTSPVDRIEFRARAQNLLSLGRRLRGARDDETVSLGWAALDSLPEAILVVGSAGEVRALNGAARRQLPDSPLPVDLAGLAGQRFAARVGELARRGEQAWSEAVLRDRTGDMLRVIVRCWPVPGADGAAWTCVRIEGEAGAVPPACSLEEVGR